MDIALKHWRGLERPFRGVQHEEKKKQTFSSTFWEAALLLDGFLRDMDSRNHAINPILLAKYQSFIPLPSWCTADDMTDRQIYRQTNRQTIKARGTSMIQETTSPFGNENVPSAGTERFIDRIVCGNPPTKWRMQWCDSATVTRPYNPMVHQ